MSLCLEPPSPFVLSTAWHLLGSKPPRPPEALVLWRPLTWGRLYLGRCLSRDRSTRASPLLPTLDLTTAPFRALKILLLDLRPSLAAQTGPDVALPENDCCPCSSF